MAQHAAGQAAPPQGWLARWSRSRQSQRRWSWVRRIAIEPSPTADATRFTDRWRTSPTANTPAGWTQGAGEGAAAASLGRSLASQQIRTGDHEPPLVAFDIVWQPMRMGLGADQDEQGHGRNSL